MNTGIAEILAKKVERQAKAAERKAEREENGKSIVNGLHIERTPTGLYYCRYDRGPVPTELKGFFTTKQKILEIVNRRGINLGE